MLLIKVSSRPLHLLSRPSPCFGVLAVSLLLVAHATAVEKDETFNPPNPAVGNPLGSDYPGTGSITFPQFDPTLGALNSVTLNLQGWYNVGFFLSDDSQVNDAAGTVNFGMTMGVSGDNLAASLRFLYSQNYCISIYDNTDNPFAAYGSGSSQSIFTAASVLNECIGSGSINLNGNLSFGPTFSPPSPDISYDFHEGDAFLYGSITYGYSVPDAGSTLGLLVLAAGFLVVADKLSQTQSNRIKPCPIKSNPV
jgi:hypothetical protein